MNVALFKETWLPLEDLFHKVAFHILEDDAEARDAVQDLYIKLWNGRETQVLSPKAYGATLLKNLCLDRLRKRKNEARTSIGEGEERLESGLEAPDGRIIGKETLKEIGYAMEALPEKWRKLLEMKVLKGMSYEEISKETGLSEVNIRVHISKARKQLKKCLES